MILPTSIRWRKPAPVAHWEWRTIGLPFTKRLTCITFCSSLLLGIPALCAVAWVDPSALLRASLAVAGLCCIFPVSLLLEPWLKKHWFSEYTLDERGFANEGIRQSWNDVQSCTILDHPSVYGIRVVEFRLNNSSLPHTLEFDPSKVAESEIVAALNQHLNARVLLRPAIIPSGENETLLRAARDGAAMEQSTLVRPMDS